VPVTLAEWHHLAGIWSRYLLGFPGAVLAAYALYRNSAQLITPLSEPRTLRTLHWAGIALAGYAIMGGLIVSPGPYFPANWLNTETLENWLTIPVPVYRSMLGFMLMLAVIRSLEIFDLEIDRKLSAMEEAQILATERDRIGRDLHDRTLQSVYATGLLLNAAHDLLNQSQNEAATATLNQAMTTLDQAVDDIRRHIAELRLRPTSLSLALNLPEAQPFEAGQISYILAIAGEALSNVARHAQARRVQFIAQMENNCFCLAITDDGQGIPPDYVAGYGLQNMRDRTRLLGGELTLHSQPGQGTRLQLTVLWEMSK
jgi:signal transduction histidine kinase